MTNLLKRKLLFLLAALLVPAMAVYPAPTARGQEAAPAPPPAPADADDASRLQNLPSDVSGIDTSKQGFNSCAECHASLSDNDALIVEQFKGSVHQDLGFRCIDCHGGDDSTMLFKVAMSPEKGFIGKPDRKAVLAVCSRCHSDPSSMRQYGSLRTDQLELYKTSMHGIALFERNDTNVAVCSDCHTAHNILRVSDPDSSVYKKNIVDTCGRCHGDAALMKQYGLDGDIPSKYKHSEHGRLVLEQGDMGAPVCNNCHGNHGAMPPGIASIEHVCGQCHLRTEQYYDQSKHAKAFAELGLGRCVVCHNQHALQKPTDDFLNAGVDANCVQCHDQDSPQYATITKIHDSITKISGMHDDAQAALKQTEQTTHLSMHDITPQVEQIHTSLLTARALQHAANVEEMDKNLATATSQFKAISDFTTKLLNRSKFNKLMVALLAALLFFYGIFILIYKKKVLDVVIPWQYYEGPPRE